MKSAFVLSLIAAMALALAPEVRAQDRERERTAPGSEEVRRERNDRDQNREQSERRRGERDDRRTTRTSDVLGDILGRGEVVGARRGDIPPGHYPPPGECRVWYPDRPAGHQPPPEPCGLVRSRRLDGAFVLYGDGAYDAERVWSREEAARERIPDVIWEILRHRE